MSATKASHDMEGIFGRAVPFPDGISSSGSASIAPIAVRTSRKQPGWKRKLVLSCVAVGGALVASVAVTQGNVPDLAAQRLEQPVKPVAARIDLTKLGPVKDPPKLARVERASSASEGRPEVAAIVKSPPPARKPSKSAKPGDKQKDRLVARSASATPRSSADSCHRMSGVELARCMRPQILDADQELRTAYDEAVRAGVDRRVLSRHQRQWTKLRKRANSDPRTVAFGYRDMARQLDATRVGLRSGDF